jgi:hypothetical protein
MNDAPANRLEIAAPEPQGEGWSRTKWLVLVALVFAAHIGFIFALGERTTKPARAVKNVPALKFADNSSELLALDDPALFALPNPKDFASAVWLKMPGAKQPSFRWTEAPRWLPLAVENLGTTFVQFMQTNYFAGYQLDFKPPPKLSEPVAPVQSALPQNSTLQIGGELAQRQLLNEINPPSLPYDDVIAPSKVQVLVSAAGDVVSAVLLPSDNSGEAADRYNAADRCALELARTARFAPATNLTIGQMVFNWRTIPMTTTNDNPNAH